MKLGKFGVYLSFAGVMGLFHSLLFVANASILLFIQSFILFYLEFLITFLILDILIDKYHRKRRRRKTLVPTKYQAKHKWRSDWIKVSKITYAESAGIFKSVNQTGVIETEAEFANLLYVNYGPGIYHINAWRKGRQGIISFYHVELTHNGFKRMRKNITVEEKDKKENIKELRSLQKELTNTAGNDRIQVQQNIDDMKEEIGFDSELIGLMKSNNSITGQYIKSAMPVYRMHAYQSHKNKKSDSVEVGDLDSFY